MSGRLGVIRFALTLLLLAFGAMTVHAQAFPTVFPKPVLILDQERLFSDTNLGRAIALGIALRRTALLQESRELDLAFETEELRLTETRVDIPPEEFRILSEGFDQRVQEARQTQLGKDVAMQQEIDGQRRRFLTLTVPYLSQIMLKYAAGAIIDQRSVLLFNRDMDITDETIALLDRAFDANPDMAIEKE